VSHLLAVSSLVQEAGGDEDQATAGLLHDMLEDQGARTSYEEIQKLFGGEVARIVRACADTAELPKPPRRDRKIAYLKHLDDADPAVLRLSLADKLHKARSILTDLREHGDDLWKRFNASREDRLGATKGSRQSSRSACPHRSKVTYRGARQAGIDRCWDGQRHSLSATKWATSSTPPEVRPTRR
jgi:(p)ppGpp synthase/HD superfamily hydrolase